MRIHRLTHADPHANQFLHRLAYCTTVGAATAELPGVTSPLACKEEARFSPLICILYLIDYAEIYC